jgi:cytoskeleton protein RodZ
VTHDAEQPKPFDEQAALAELERLADKIQMTRRKRAETVDEFDAFVRGFREERHAAARAGQAATQSSSAATSTAAATTPPPQSNEPVASPRPSLTVAPITDPLRSDQSVELPVAAGGRGKQTSRSIVPLAIAGVAALFVLFFIVRAMSGGAAATPQPAPKATPAASAPAPQPSPAATSPGPAPIVPATPRRAINIELTTLRAVWARVVVDGAKTVERELPAGTKLPIGADRSVSIRAGDAGAVTLVVDGKDQGVMGRDGFPATKTFAKSQ